MKKAVLLLVCTTVTAVAACVSYNEDYDSCDYNYYKSHNDQQCNCALRTKPLTSLFHPGFRLEQQSGHLVISALADASPAKSAGLRVGDTVLSIAGSDAAAIYAEPSRNPWNSGVPKAVTVVVNRSGKLIAAEVSSLPVTAYLDRLWGASGSALIGAGYRVNHGSQQLHRAYSLGLAFLMSGKEVIVSDILPDGPAAGAGINIGDQIILVNGTAVDSLSNLSLERLLNPDGAIPMKLELRRSSHRIVAVVQPQSISVLMFAPDRLPEPALASAR